MDFRYLINGFITGTFCNWLYYTEHVHWGWCLAIFVGALFAMMAFDHFILRIGR